MWKEIQTPTPWKPCVGESIEGTYEGMQTARGTYGLYDQAILRIAAGLVAISGAQLTQALSLSRVSCGNRLRIKYLGTKASQTNPSRALKTFNISVLVPDPSGGVPGANLVKGLASFNALSEAAPSQSSPDSPQIASDDILSLLVASSSSGTRCFCVPVSGRSSGSCERGCFSEPQGCFSEPYNLWCSKAQAVPPSI